MPKPLVLVLAYIYPPSRYCEIAGQRPVKFAKFLPQFGWDSVVITRQWDDNSAVSPYIVPNRKSEVPTLLTDDCIRNKALSVPFEVSLRHRAAMLLTDNRKPRLLSRIARKAITVSKLAFPNHTQTNWLKYAKALAIRVHEVTPIQAIVATCPPPDTLELAAGLSNRFKIPWIADLRDRVQECFPTNFRLSRDTQKCARIIRTASASVVVSEALADSEREDLRLNARPIVIANGFDEDDYSLISVKPDSFSVVYTGSLYPNRRDPAVFLQGLRMFYDKKLIPQGIKHPIFKYAGTSTDLLKSWAKEHQIEHGVEILGHLSRDDSLRLQMSAGILLHVTESAGATGIATGKIYEYFAAGRPILATPGDHSTADELISRTQTGSVARNPTEVHDALCHWYDEWNQCGRLNYSPNLVEISKFRRRDQAGSLAQLLNSVTTR